jgi:transcriptional regulator with XRE-family HTH domain
MSVATEPGLSWIDAYVRLRNQLRRARAEAGLTQGQLAARLALSERHVSRLESGETNPTARVLYAWANAVGLRMNLTDMSGQVVRS